MRNACEGTDRPVRKSCRCPKSYGSTLMNRRRDAPTAEQEVVRSRDDGENWPGPKALVAERVHEESARRRALQAPASATSSSSSGYGERTVRRLGVQCITSSRGRTRVRRNGTRHAGLQGQAGTCPRRAPCSNSAGLARVAECGSSAIESSDTNATPPRRTFARAHRSPHRTAVRHDAQIAHRRPRSARTSAIGLRRNPPADPMVMPSRTSRHVIDRNSLSGPRATACHSTVNLATRDGWAHGAQRARQTMNAVRNTGRRRAESRVTSSGTARLPPAPRSSSRFRISAGK
jgi:hypothetical protein